MNLDLNLDFLSGKPLEMMVFHMRKHFPTRCSPLQKREAGRIQYCFKPYTMYSFQILGKFQKLVSLMNQSYIRILNTVTKKLRPQTSTFNMAIYFYHLTNLSIYFKFKNTYFWLMLSFYSQKIDFETCRFSIVL